MRNSPRSDAFREPSERRRRHDRCLDLRLLPFVVLRELAEEQIGDDEAEHGVAEELERLVVEHAAAGVLVHARPVCQRVFEEPGIPEPVADPVLEPAELVAQRDDAAAGHFLAMRFNQPPGLRRIHLADRHPQLARSAHRDREHGARQPG